MTQKYDAEVAIIGAGPVGLTLALFLARHGVEVVVLEKDPAINTAPRAMVYLHPLLKDLDEIGMLEKMIERAWLDREGFNLHLPALNEVISIPNTALDGIDPHPYNLHLGQGEYAGIAAELLADLPSARLLMESEVEAIEDLGESVVLRIRGAKSLTARWVVGADGGRSLARQSIGAALDGFTWGQRFVATNVRWDFRSRGFKSSNMYVDDEIGCIIAQITPDGLWRCTYQESLELPEETVAERIPQHFDRLLGPGAGVELVDYRPYRMHQRLASTLRRGRVILAGDAAHLTNPTGGLGLTTGLYDVFLLQEALLSVVRGESDDFVLDAYASERSRVFRDIASPNATNFKRLVYDSHDLDALDRSVQPFREIASSLEAQRNFLSGLDMVRSPALNAAG